MGVPLSFILMFRARSQPLSSLIFLSWALVPLYALHQFEEHGYDCFARRYSFQEYFNSMTAKSLGIRLNAREITIINVILVWFGFPMCAVMAERRNDFIPAALFWGLATFNAMFAHIMPMVFSGAYNPGAFQSFFMAPIGIHFLRQMLRLHGPLLVIVALLYGSVFAHAACILLPVSLIQRGLLSTDGYALWMAAGVALPAIASAPLRRLCPARDEALKVKP